MKKIVLAVLLISGLLGCELTQEGSTKKTEEPVVISHLVVNPESIVDLQVGTSTSLSVQAHYSDGSFRRVTSNATYQSDLISVENSMAVAIAEGTGVLTIQYEGLTEEIPVSTVENYQSLAVSLQPISSGSIGDSYEFTATLTLKDNSTQIISPEDGLEIETSTMMYNEIIQEDSEGTVLSRTNTLRAVNGGSETITFKYLTHTASVDVSIEDFVFGSRRYLPQNVLSRKAVGYSGYRDGMSPGEMIYPSETQILEDLKILEKAGFSFLRLWDASTHAERTLSVIANPDNNLDMVVQLGVWIDGPNKTDNVPNWEQVDKALELITTYPDIIASVSVGNECMVDWNSWAWAPPEDMKGYIQYVRSNTTIPVTTDDNWEPFAINDISNDEGEDDILVNGDLIYRNGDPSTPYETRQVAEVIDYLALHTYPIADSPYGIWDYQQLDVPVDQRAEAMMDVAFIVAKKQYQAARDGLDSWGLTDMPIIIGETGWKHADTSGWPDRAHPVNAKMFYDRMMNWVYGTERADSATNGPLVCFYFEAFDEPWKEGDDGWGLFNVQREPNYVIWSQSDSDDFVNPDPTNTLTDSDAIYYTE